MKIATVAVYVSNQPQALRFWTEQVGFVVHRNRPMGPKAAWLEVGPPGAQACLVLYPRDTTQDWEQRKPSVVFECANIQEAYQRLKDAGVTFTQPPQEMPWGLFAIFVDPDGNWFGLRQAETARPPQ